MTRWRRRITSPRNPTTLDLGGHHGAAVLVWITDLGNGADSSGRFHAQIAELSLTAK